MENDERSNALAEVFEAFKVINFSLRCYYAGEQQKSCQESQPHNTNRENPSASPTAPGRRHIRWS